MKTGRVSGETNWKLVMESRNHMGVMKWTGLSKTRLDGIRSPGMYTRNWPQSLNSLPDAESRAEMRSEGKLKSNVA